MLEALIQSGEALVRLLPVAVFFIALAAITKRRRILDAWRQCRRESMTNLAIAIFDTVVLLPLIAIPALWLVESVGVPVAIAAFWKSMPLALACVAAVLMGDFIGYWRHRLEHLRPLWPAHSTHHSDQTMNWLTLVRMNPLNRLSTVTIDMTLLTLCGFPPVAVIFNFLVRNWWGFFIHADLPWTLGWVGRWAISPAAHRVHHARDERLSGYNFATVFTFWDRIWGTYRDPRDLLGIPTGIESGSLSFVGELLRPVIATHHFLAYKWRSKRLLPITPPA